MHRRTLREKAIQGLFQIDMTQIQPAQALENMMFSDEDLQEISVEEKAFLFELMDGTYEKKQDLDPIISKFLKGWTLSRLSIVDRSILRLAVYEILYRDDIPGKVSVNEAIELTKRFSTDESKQYINGVLSNILEEHAPPGG